MTQGPYISFTAEMTQNELNAFRYIPLFKKSFLEGASVKDLITLTQHGSILSIEKALKDLQDDPSILDSPIYFSTKILVRETKAWVKLIYEAFTEYAEKRIAEDIYKIEIAPVLEKLSYFELQLNNFIPPLLSIRKQKLHTDFTSQIARINEQMEIILLDFVKTKKNISLLNYSIGKKIIAKVNLRLAETKEILVQYRDQFELKALELGCNILIDLKDIYPYPILYTKAGDIYIIQEVVEHFVGAGYSKIVSRTFEMQSGSVRALMRPKKMFEDHFSQEEKINKMEIAFLQSFLEADIIRHIRGKRGVIQQYEASAFDKDGDKAFYQICELYDSSEIAKIFHKILHSENTSPSKESIALIAKDLIYGLISLKTSGVIHRDLKNDNILAHEESKHIKAGARIIDFNNACLNTQLQAKTTFLVAEIYPPEFCKIYINNGYKSSSDEYKDITTFSMDTWAIGLHLYILFFKEQLPWEKPHNNENLINAELSPSEIKKIKDQETKKIAKLIADLKEDWIDLKFQNNPMYPLIRATLEIDPSRRISAENALALFEKLLPQYLASEL